MILWRVHPQFPQRRCHTKESSPLGGSAIVHRIGYLISVYRVSVGTVAQPKLSLEVVRSLWNRKRRLKSGARYPALRFIWPYRRAVYQRIEIETRVLSLNQKGQNYDGALVPFTF
jgi:hypothetical protein